MEPKSRMSLNTSIKDAKIFDDSSNEEDYYFDNEDAKNNIKKEEDNGFGLNYYIDTLPANELKSILKKENTFDEKKIKIEFDEEEENDTTDNNTISQKVAQLGLVTPVKKEEITRNTFKSAKRSLTKPRNSPYAKEKSEPSNSVTPKKRESSENIHRVPKTSKSRKHVESETNPAVLARRQKQIDFGKNTIGYDNYINTVPRHARKSEDPMTPNKYRVYSRRGFDGLIKQWRLKLHKYDS